MQAAALDVSDVGQIDQVMAEIQDLKQRRKEVHAELRRKGGWWRLF